ncbi:ATP-binding protein [Haloplanus halophilus]|uniref:sensor histidine kinase n=1 Tax=Haloplanus halophilus TaxID=2949993 RepID=UPI00203D6E25|nr:ATP-binding protein [Haloplanus sp. GDY1]
MDPHTDGMNPVLLGHLFVFGLSGLVCLASIPRARGIQHAGTRTGLVGLLLSVALWSGSYVGYLLAPTTSSKLGCYILGFSFALVAVGAFLYFCAAYTGRPPRRAPYRKAIVGVFLLILSLKITNPLHRLYFTSTWATDPFPHLAIQHQLLYWIVLGVSYALVAVGFFMLVEQFYHTGTDSRPLVVLAGMTGIPAIATILGPRIDSLLPLMYEPPGVAIFAVGTLFVYLRRFEAIRLTGETSEPAIFLDSESRIRDYNQAAEEIVPALRGSTGRPLEEVDQSLVDRLADSEILTLTRDDDVRHYQISHTPFTSGEVMTGQLITITDVSAREEYRQQLEAKTEQLEALNRVVRHDIRNDMAVIHGWASTLHEHVDDDGAEALERVIQRAEHVIELTDTAREFIDSLSGDRTVEVTAVDLGHHLRTELTAVRESYPDAQFTVHGSVPDTAVRANEMLSSVFRNVLENAVRHSDVSTPEVDVSCEEDGDTVRVRIADNGPGVPDDRKSRIFGKGEKGIESPGSGIGLYLVSTLTEQFGGRVWVEDNDPRGAVFVVELEKHG